MRIENQRGIKKNLHEEEQSICTLKYPELESNWKFNEWQMVRWWWMEAPLSNWKKETSNKKK